MTDAEPGFEIEVATVEEFVRLLVERNEGGSDRQGCGASEEAVFVAQVMDRRPSDYGYPLMRRCVVAAFARGIDQITYTRTTSNAVELPETVAGIEDRQQVAYGEVWSEIEGGLENLRLSVPLREGFLRHAADNGRGRGDGSG